jgi:hypothetical protein
MAKLVARRRGAFRCPCGTLDLSAASQEATKMFASLTLEENNALWAKLIHANKKFRAHAEYLIELCERRQINYPPDEIDIYLLCANEQHSSLDELTDLMARFI